MILAVTAPAVGQDVLKSPATAPVIVDGRVLFHLRTIPGSPATERANDIEKRIAKAARDKAVSPDSLRVVPDEFGSALVVEGHVIVLITEADAEAQAFTVELYAGICREKVRKAIQDYRRDRESGLTLKNVGLAVAMGVLLVLVLVVLIRLSGRVERMFGQRYRRKVEEVQSRGFQLVSTERIWWLMRAATSGARVVGVAILVYAYLQWALELFPWTRLFGRNLLELVREPVRAIILGFVGYLPEMVFLIILAFVGRWSLGILRKFFDAIGHGTIVLNEFDAEWAMPTFRIARVFVIALFAVVAFPYIPGSGSEAFKGVSLLLGVLFSLGSSSVVANMVAGYTMIYRKAFRIGDRIHVKEFRGDVVAMRQLVTVLRTPKNEEVVLPNSDVLNNPITNFSAMAREGKLRLHTTVGIGYEVPWRQVEAMLLMAADRAEGFNKELPAYVLQKSMDDFCVVYEINVHCDNAQRMARLYTALHRCIQDVFNEYGVQIMTPAYEGDPQTPKVVPPENLYDAPASPSGD
ncbi:MAG: mechanosensitive ion channel [Candidatus Krumholzibacteria bacterium]|nr:mechanosensitive ion channel [Candidatus Krumholzibacteria bacterium]